MTRTASPSSAPSPSTPSSSSAPSSSSLGPVTAPAPPAHVAVVMDGNRRWATQHGLTPTEGYDAGTRALRSLIGHALAAGIPYLTVYALSTENLQRDPDEVGGLMSVLADGFARHRTELEALGIRLHIAGRLQGLPVRLRSELPAPQPSDPSDPSGPSGPSGPSDSENTALTLTLTICVGYSGRAEIAAAAQEMARDAVEGNLDPTAVDEYTFGHYLHRPELPDVDLLIRTAGEQRLSNFLLWQTAYAELVFTEKLWPDFGESDFHHALKTFAGRTRRFGIS